MQHFKIWILCVVHFVLIAIVAGFNPFMDKDLFKINWVGPISTQRLQDSEPNRVIQDEDLVSVTTKYNEQYQCLLPDDPLNREKLSKSSYTGLSPEQIMKNLFNQKSCSYRIETFWTYELCHGKHIRQYHETKEPNQKSQIQEYYLGYYDKEQKTMGEAKKESVKVKTRRIEGVDLPYYEVSMIGGTKCDLTGGSRQATILYLCQPEGRGEVYEFKEIRTCEYELIVLTNVLCAHPDFRPKNPEINQIKCFPLEGSPIRPKQLDSLNQEANALNPFHTSTNKKDILDADSLSIHIEGSIQDGKTTGPQVHIRRKTADPPPVADSIGSTTDTSMIRDFLRGDNCLQGGNGWWKHEYCHGKFVRQYHDDSEGRQILQLGVWNENAHLNWLQENPTRKPRSIGKRKYLSLHYSGGSMCELTGKPRYTEVRLKCVEKKDQPHSMAVYLLEPNTCEYVLGVESPLFCPLLDKADDNGLLKNVEV